MEGCNGLNMAWLAHAVLLMVPSWVTGFSFSTVAGVEEAFKQC